MCVCVLVSAQVLEFACSPAAELVQVWVWVQAVHGKAASSASKWKPSILPAHTPQDSLHVINTLMLAAAAAATAAADPSLTAP
jgi:hypothetical protein